MCKKKPLVLPVETPLGYYLYDANRNETIFTGKELFHYVQDVLDDSSNLSTASNEVVQQYLDLQRCGYLLPRNIEIIEHPLTKLIPVYLERSVSKLALQVTQQCNMRCKYCVYSDSGNFQQRCHSTKKMSFQTAKKAIDFYRQHSMDAEEALIGFYGGEPLLAFQLIKESVLYAEEVFAGKQLEFFMTTNATLLTEEVIDFILAHNFRLAFSIDGPKLDNDRNRVLANGQGTYDLVIKNLHTLYNRDPLHLGNSSISMVVDSEQTYDNLLSFLEMPIFTNVDFTYSAIEKDGETQDFPPKFMEKYKYDWFITLSKAMRGGKVDNLNQFMKYGLRAYTAGRNKMHSNFLQKIGAPNGPCLPGKMRLLVSCDEKLYACEKVNENSTMQIGTLDNGFDYAKIAQHLNVGRLDPEKCKNCWAIQLCNICSKSADNGKALDPTLRNKACKDAKAAAYSIILEAITRHETQLNAHITSELEV